VHTHPQVQVHTDELSTAFVRLPLAALQDPSLTAHDVRVLAQLIWYAYSHYPYPGHASLADELGSSLARVERSMTSLSRAAWIDRSCPGPGATSRIRIPSLRRQLPLDLDPRSPTTSTSAGQDPAYMRGLAPHIRRTSESLEV